jgi:hypothetical protein
VGCGAGPRADDDPRGTGGGVPIGGSRATGSDGGALAEPAGALDADGGGAVDATLGGGDAAGGATVGGATVTWGDGSATVALWRRTTTTPRATHAAVTSTPPMTSAAAIPPRLFGIPAALTTLAA